jgi:hypothetical protein
MPRYYFNLEGGSHGDNDRSGTLLSNDSAARDYAERIVGELQDAGGYDGAGLTMVVKDTDGRTIFSIPFLEL